ncbi:MAG: c-type cytochrome, partial [Fimbriimonadales bacterium]
YTWPMHGSLKLFSSISPNFGWIGSLVLPGLFVFFIISAPWVARRVAPKAIQGAFFGFAAYFLLAGLFFAGRFAPLTGNRDPVPAAVTDPHSNHPAGSAGPKVSTPPVDPGPGDKVLMAKGRDLFNSNACAGCHGVDGRNGTEGPNLLGVASRRGVDPTWYIAFFKNPASLNPNTIMPSFTELSPEESRAIAEFLIHQAK